MVSVTQPPRVVAVSMAKRVALDGVDFFYRLARPIPLSASLLP